MHINPWESYYEAQYREELMYQKRLILDKLLWNLPINKTIENKKEKKMSEGALMIVNERRKQINKYSNDTQYSAGTLAKCGAVYAIPRDERVMEGEFPLYWPISEIPWKDRSSNRLQELVVAATFIVAEIDEILREQQKDTPESKAPVENESQPTVQFNGIGLQQDQIAFPDVSYSMTIQPPENGTTPGYNYGQLNPLDILGTAKYNFGESNLSGQSLNNLFIDPNWLQKAQK